MSRWSISNFGVYRASRFASAHARWRAAARVAALRWDSFHRPEAEARVSAFAPYLAALDVEAVASEAFDSTYAVNVKPPFSLTAARAPRMAASGGGANVRVTAMVANVGMPRMSLYGSTKSALTLLTEGWAAEYGPKGARVNAVAREPTRTPGAEPIGGGLDELAATLPLSRPARAEEIAAAALFLGSDEASHINDAVLAVDGGRAAI